MVKKTCIGYTIQVFFKKFNFFYFFLLSLFIPYPNAAVSNANKPPSIGNPGGGGLLAGGVCENINSAVIKTTNIKIILSVFFFITFNFKINPACY